MADPVAGPGLGAMAGIAVDPRGQVWMFHRGPRPLQVFAPTAAWSVPGGKAVPRAPPDPVRSRGVSLARRQRPPSRAEVRPRRQAAPHPRDRWRSGRRLGHFNRPTDMAITSTGEVFVSDGYGNNRIVHFDRDGRFVKAWGSLGTEPGSSACPIPSPSIHGEGSTSPIATTPGSRSSTRTESSSRSGAT